MRSWLIETPAEHAQAVVDLSRLSPPLKISVAPISARTAQQNRKMWSMLQDLSDQVTYYGHSLSKEEWKDLLTASLRQHRMYPSIDNPDVQVICGASTSNMGIKTMSDLIDRIEAFGNENDVVWSVEMPGLR